jgi:hypothetical protein
MIISAIVNRGGTTGACPPDYQEVFLEIIGTGATG